MILPTKHLTLTNSLLNTGAVILQHLEESQTVTLLWTRTRTLPEIKSFERFCLGLDFLYILGLVDFQDGLVRRM